MRGITKRILPFFLALVLAFPCPGLTAAAGEEMLTLQDLEAMNGGEVKVYTDHHGQAAFVEGKCTTDPVRNEEDAERVVRSMLKLMGGDEKTRFEPWRTIRDPFGHVVYVFQQVYSDTIVLGGAVKVMTDASGAMLGLTASVVSELPETEESEGLTAREAEQVVLSHEKDAGNPAPQLVEGMTQKIVLPIDRELDMEADEILSRFVWAVYTTNTAARLTSPSHLPYLAHYVTLSGEYLYSLETILPADRAGMAGYTADYVFAFMTPATYTGYVDLHDGSEMEITVDLMRDTRTGMYYLGNLERRIVVADCWEFLYNHGSVVLEYSPDNLEWDQTGLLSLYNYCRAYDYYKAIGWESCDGAGTPIIILKDFCDQDHMPINNAAYAGKFYGWQTFLSSSINEFSQCLDVLAHEYTHGVTGSVMTHNEYMNDYGAINEAISDIQGNLCEMMAGDTTDETWLLGEKVEAIRSMSDPHKLRQPAFSWDIYYMANVREPTEANDRGGVHANSSLLNRIAYLLCDQGGMTLEEARAFWFAVDCAMVPGTDYAMLDRLLPFVLKISDMEDYQSAMETALMLTRLGDNRMPETLDPNLALLKLDLPDTEVFRNGKWALSVLSIDVNGLMERAKTVIEDLKTRHLDGYPRSFRILSELFFPPEGKTGIGSVLTSEDFWEILLEAVLDSIGTGEETDTEAPGLSENAELKAIKEWVDSQMKGTLYLSSGSAGQDGHTISMMSRPGWTIPTLQYISLKPNSDQIEQMNQAVYFNRHWVDVTPLLDALFSMQGEETDVTALLDYIWDRFLAGFFEMLKTNRTVDDWLDALILDVQGGEICEISGKGLENLDFTYNMAFDMDEEPVLNNRKSRPKWPADTGAEETTTEVQENPEKSEPDSGATPDGAE